MRIETTGWCVDNVLYAHITQRASRYTFFGVDTLAVLVTVQKMNWKYAGDWRYLDCSGRSALKPKIIFTSIFHLIDFFVSKYFLTFHWHNFTFTPVFTCLAKIAEGGKYPSV